MESWFRSGVASGFDILVVQGFVSVVMFLCVWYLPTVSCPVSWPMLLRALTVTFLSDCMISGLSCVVEIEKGKR